MQDRLRTLELCHTQMHISNLFSDANPFSSQIYKINQYTTIKHQTQILKLLVHSMLPPLKKIKNKKNKKKEGQNMLALHQPLTIPADLLRQGSRKIR